MCLLQAKPYQSVNVDLWSVGIILFIMVTGSMPYHDKHVSVRPLPTPHSLENDTLLLQRMVKQQLKRELHWPSRAKDASKQVRDLVLRPPMPRSLE